MADTNSNPNELSGQIDGQSSQEESKTAGEQSEGTEKEQTDLEHKESSDETSEGSGEGESKESNGEEQPEDREKGNFFDPEKVPEELKPVYKQMQAAFTQKTQGVAELRKELENLRDTFKQEPQEKQADKVAESIVQQVLKTRGIDPNTIEPNQKAFLDLVEDVARQASRTEVGKSVAPLYEATEKREVESFFEKNPKATPYRKAMADIDRATKGTLTLDQLHFLAARRDMENQSREKDSQRAESKRLNNTESSQSSAMGAPEGDNPFKGMVESAQESKLPF